MSTLLQVLIYASLGGLVSLIGGMLLLSSKDRAEDVAKYATPFAAGALLAAAFYDILPEASHSGDVEQALRFTLVGILIFFLLERFLYWFHHHHDDDVPEDRSSASLIVIGDTMHNFIDGIAIAAGFLVDPSTGVVVTLAVAAHEIPQEIGDFGLLLKKGMSRKKVLLVNLVSAFVTTISAGIFFTLGQETDLPLEILLGLVAGFFIYVAVSDIIPSIHQHESKSNLLAGPQTVLLITGAIIVATTTSYLHQFIEVDAGHNEQHSSEEHDDEHHEEESANHSHDL